VNETEDGGGSGDSESKSEGSKDVEGEVGSELASSEFEIVKHAGWVSA